MVNKENGKKIDKKAKTYVIFISIAILIIVSIVAFVWRGTFASDTINLSINCPMTDTSSGTIQCNIVLNSTANSINGIKANYLFSEGIGYVGFESSKSSCQNENQCIVEATENGFVVGDVNGFSATETIGTLTLSLPSELVEGSSYTITLNNIELSTSTFENIDDYPNLSATITVGYNQPPSEDISFDESLTVNEVYRIIERLISKEPITSSTYMTYDDLRNKITINSSATFGVFDSQGNIINTNSKVRTNDVIKISFGGTVYSYKISVLGDLNGDGEITINDVTRLYYHIKNVETITDPALLAAGDIIKDGNYNINELTLLYYFLKGVQDTLRVGGV